MTNNKNKKLILGFTGKIASGKGTVAEYLKEKHNASIHRFSTVLRDILIRLYLEESRTNMQDISLALRKTFGEDVLSSVIAKDVNDDPAPIIAIDGVRRKSDIKYLKALSNFHLIYITTKEKNRYERIIKRGENPDDIQKTFEQFQKDSKNEAEQQIEKVTKLATHTIDNNGTFEELYGRIEHALQKIRGKK